MSKELQCLATVGSTQYAQIIRRTDGAIWNTSGSPNFETYQTANIANYAITMTQAGSASGIYTGNFPTGISNGLYLVIFRTRAGGSPAESDVVSSSGEFHWSGTARTSLAGAPYVSALSVSGQTNFSGAVQLAAGAIIQNQPDSPGLTLTGSGVGDALRIVNIGTGAGIKVIGVSSGLTIDGNVGIAVTGSTSGITINGNSSVGLQITGSTNGVLLVGANAAAIALQSDTYGIDVSAGSNATNGLSYVQNNRALNEFEFLMTDSTNHSPATELTVSVTRSIDGGAFDAGTLSAVTEVGSGIYKVDFAAADMNGVVITLKATATGADTTLERIITQP